jgi:hypothetical protein
MYTKNSPSVQKLNLGGVIFFSEIPYEMRNPPHQKFIKWKLSNLQQYRGTTFFAFYKKKTHIKISTQSETS